MFDASMKFDLGQDVNALRDVVHRRAQERIKPMAAQIDRSNEFPARREALAKVNGQQFHIAVLALPFDYPTDSLRDIGGYRGLN